MKLRFEIWIFIQSHILLLIVLLISLIYFRPLLNKIEIWNLLTLKFRGHLENHLEIKKYFKNCFEKTKRKEEKGNVGWLSAWCVLFFIIKKVQLCGFILYIINEWESGQRERERMGQTAVLLGEKMNIFR